MSDFSRFMTIWKSAYMVCQVIQSGYVSDNLQTADRLRMDVSNTVRKMGTLEERMMHTA